MVEGDAAGFAGDGPEVHDVAAVRDGHRGILRAPPGEMGRYGETVGDVR